ncbi:MAG: response regulator [Gammaproteobacteria bacterium]|nr:response regulator [Gammaproteobacteria bacterium]MDH5778316.1 response regulator [Gammaproteobacteria bacterium]
MAAKKEASVLIVDDDDMNRDLLSRGLEKHHLITTSVSSGKAALAQFDIQLFDIVLLDINMPGMDGFEVLERIKTNEKLSNIKVIMMSAQNELEAVKKCKEMGANDYILKPLSLAVVVKRVRNQLDESFITQSVQAAGVSSKMATILIVDDEDINRSLLERRIKKYGYTPITASSASAAIKILRQYSVDLILLDIMMPEVDGVSLLEQIKQIDSVKHIPVIMLTGQSDQESIARCMELGATDYMLKPFNNTYLKQRIEAYLK